MYSPVFLVLPFLFGSFGYFVHTHELSYQLSIVKSLKKMDIFLNYSNKNIKNKIYFWTGHLSFN